MARKIMLAPDWLPIAKYSIFFCTTVLAIIVMLLLSLPAFHVLRCGKEGSTLDSLTYYVDPLFAHLLGLTIAAMLMWLETHNSSAKKWTRLAICIGVPLMTFVAMHLFVDVVLKPSFAYDRPVIHLRSPWLTKILRVDEPCKGDSCPSGFVVRQMFLFMIGLVFYHGFQSRKVPEKGSRIEYLLLISLGLSVIFVAFSRIYRGFHTMYDVGISVSVSCYLFWLFYYLIGVFPRRVPINMTSGIVAASCIFIPTFIYYSQDAHWWAIIGIAVFWLIGLTRIIPGGGENGG